LKWLNEFGEYYNYELQSKLDKLRVLHPHTNIIYADYYNAALPLYREPTKFGNLLNSIIIQYTFTSNMHLHTLLK